MSRLWPLCLLLLAGCPAPRSQCDRNAKSTVELRDGQGVLLLSGKPGPNGTTDVCDGAYARVGNLKAEGGTLTLLDRGGAPRLQLRRNGPDDAEASGANGLQRLRVHREGNQLFVLEVNGIRMGTLVDGAPATIYDRTQVPVASVQARGSDQAILDPQGSALYLVQPATSAQLAGLFYVSGLDRSEQLALYLLLSR